MEEKERYEILNDGLIYDGYKKEYLFSPSLLRKEQMMPVCDLLNQQSKRIKELEQENQQLKLQLKDSDESYNNTMRYLNNTRSELLNLPKKIVGEIKDLSIFDFEAFEEFKIRRYRITEKALDIILKKYIDKKNG